MLKDKIYLILGINTDVGKTFFVENLCKGIPDIKVIKPVISGFEDGDLDSDSAKILIALGLDINKGNFDKISPWRFKDPVSPHFAGEVNYEELLRFCLENISQARESGNSLFIESAGGVMSPITYQKTFLDLARDLQIPILLVSSNYLGAISHTLTAVETLKRNSISIEKVILNENHSSDTDSAKIIKTIENFCEVDVVTMKNLFNYKNL